VDNKGKMYQCLFFICGVLIVIFLCWYLLTDIHDHGGRTNDIRNELANVGTAQRDAQSHIDNAGQRIDRSIELADEIERGIDEATERIDNSAERNAECAELVRDSESRISESRAIIQGIRERARQNGK